MSTSLTGELGTGGGLQIGSGQTQHQAVGHHHAFAPLCDSVDKTNRQVPLILVSQDKAARAQEAIMSDEVSPGNCWMIANV